MQGCLGEFQAFAAVQILEHQLLELKRQFARYSPLVQDASELQVVGLGLECVVKGEGEFAFVQILTEPLLVRGLHFLVSAVLTCCRRDVKKRKGQIEEWTTNKAPTSADTKFW